MTVLIFQNKETGRLITYSPSMIGGLPQHVDLLNGAGYEEVMILTGKDISVNRASSVRTFSAMKKSLLRDVNLKLEHQNDS
jgi:hypothetical protein